MPKVHIDRLSSTPGSSRLASQCLNLALDLATDESMQFRQPAQKQEESFLLLGELPLNFALLYTKDSFAFNSPFHLLVSGSGSDEATDQA